MTATRSPRRERAHRHSSAAFQSLDVAAREALILYAYRLAGRPMTDRDVATALGFNDMNAVRPRCTDLIDRGLLREVGEIRCQVTGITVRVCVPTAKANL